MTPGFLAGSWYAGPPVVHWGCESRPLNSTDNQSSGVLCYDLQGQGSATSFSCLLRGGAQIMPICTIFKPSCQWTIFACDFPSQQLPNPNPLRDYVLSRLVHAQDLLVPTLGHH